MSLLKKIGTGFVLLVVIFLFLVYTRNMHDSKSTTFYVTVPAATPDLDTITLNIEGEVLPMQRVSDTEYMLEVNTQEYEGGRPIRYGYVRGGFINIFGESGEHITLGNVGNRTFVPGAKENIIRDTIPEWKWFASVEENIASMADSTIVASRNQFWVGPMLVDFWNPNFPLQYNSTIDHLKRQRYNWISLAPPWDYDTLDPPIIKNEVGTVPNWPEKDLREEIRKFKAAGFKVILGPQVCCRIVSFENRSDSWWRTWYSQQKNFIKFHATVAREENVNAFFFSASPDSLPGSRNAPSFAQEEWDNLWATARESGIPVGYSFNMLPPDTNNKPNVLWPQEAAIFYNRLDFIALSLWNHVSDKEFPTQAEIDTGVDRLFVDIDYNHNLSQKPIVFTQVAYFSKNGSAMKKGNYEEFPSWEDPKKYVNNYDGRTQAMIYESLMKHIASRPFVQGFFPFGYYYATAPLNLDSDIRGKPAEKVLSNWIKQFLD